MLFALLLALSPANPPGPASHALPAWPDRAYTLHLPAIAGPLPLLVVLHGGGGSRDKAGAATCPAPDDPHCLVTLALKRGWAVALPDGSPNRPGGQRRFWSAGGGTAGWRCVGGPTCADHTDDTAYVRALLDDIAQRAPIDPRRVAVTGLSNGAAMAHRLACELSDRVSAVATVGGQMQLTSTQACAPTRAIPLLDVHGTADPCWPYDGGTPTASICGQEEGRFVSVAQTLGDWARLRGCTPSPQVEALPDPVDDGTHTTRLTFTGCSAPLVHLRVEGGGHTWPQGSPYLPTRVIGPVTQDWGNPLLMDFFEAQTSPTL